MNEIRFGAVTLTNVNKTGILKPDASGYYNMVIGGLNIANHSGHFYPLTDSVKRLFEKSSIFQRRIALKRLKCELGHPKKHPSMTDDDYVDRLLRVEETNVIAHIRDVWLDLEYGKKCNGTCDPNTVAIYGAVKPDGPHANILEKAMANPDQDVCFSIRALSDDYMIKGIFHRIITNILNWDYVTEPGISIARKDATPALEDIDSRLIRYEVLERLADIKNHSGAYSLESQTLAMECIQTLKSYDVLPRISAKGNLVDQW